MRLTYGGELPPTPASPPELTESKSSKSSSFHSYHSDDDATLADNNNFEEIGLEDDEVRDLYTMKTAASTVTPLSTGHKSPAQTRPSSASSRPPSSRGAQRELTSIKTKPLGNKLQPHYRNSPPEPNGLALLPAQRPTAMSRRGFTSPSTPSLDTSIQRKRSPSPNLTLAPNGASNARPGTPVSSGSIQSARRGSWQSARERKTALELEKECDEDDGDDVPDECFLENVPISPRPPQERIRSRPPSTSTSPERAEGSESEKPKSKGLGNGTPPVPVAQGCLKSPRNPHASLERVMSMGQFPINHNPKVRAKSWNIAHAELNEEAKALTEALEDYADSKIGDPSSRRSFNVGPRPIHEKQRVKSSMAELPPLRRSNIMIDPLPISKEKEAVLSRTRPSWLPPKDPSEERRHLREYQKMMELSIEADRKRVVQAQAKASCRDDTANSLLRIWEEHVLPNWEAVTKQKRTRELWWRGISPRSRGVVWQKAVGNELELSDASYTAALKRAKDLEKKLAAGKAPEADMRKGEWFSCIKEDAKRTYPELQIFQPGGPLHQPLVDVLMAYSMYRSDVGYIAGTNVSIPNLIICSNH
jgi:hypothetical protein